MDLERVELWLEREMLAGRLSNEDLHALIWRVQRHLLIVERKGA
jgi:hypothetical protein